jgi:hypothetical protein
MFSFVEMAKTCYDYLLEQEIFMHFITIVIYLNIFDTLIAVQNKRELYSSLQNTKDVFSPGTNQNSAANIEQMQSK